MKKILKVIIILLIMVALLNVVYVKYEEYVLEKEIEDISELNVNETDFNISTKSNFKYSEVEVAVKEYLIDYSKKSQEISKLVNDNKLNTILSAENYQADGREFIKSKEYLNNYKKEIQTAYEGLKTFTRDETINSYIEKKELSNYYNNFYDRFMFKSNIRSKIIESNTRAIKNEVNNINRVVDRELEVLNFLSSTDTWIIKDNSIMFTKEEDLNKYNEMTREIR